MNLFGGDREEVRGVGIRKREVKVLRGDGSGGFGGVRVGGGEGDLLIVGCLFMKVYIIAE